MNRDHGSKVRSYFEELENKENERLKNYAETFVSLLEKEVDILYESEEYKSFPLYHQYKTVEFKVDEKNPNIINELQRYFSYIRTEKVIKIDGFHVYFTGIGNGKLCFNITWPKPEIVNVDEDKQERLPVKMLERIIRDRKTRECVMTDGQKLSVQLETVKEMISGGLFEHRKDQQALEKIRESIDRLTDSMPPKMVQIGGTGFFHEVEVPLWKRIFCCWCC